MEKVKYTIIGAGVIGLAIAEALSGAGENEVVVFEKNEKFGQETSSRNSEVIHAGIYYPKNSLKSDLCLKGNRLLYGFCEKEGIKHSRCGKLIVATNDHEAQQIQAIYDNASSLGVPELKMLKKEDIPGYERNIFALKAIYSGTTGIIDSHAFMNCLYQKAQKMGVMFSFKNEVHAIKSQGSEGYLVVDDKGENILSEWVINCAGLGSENVARSAGMDTKALKYTLYPCKGDYFSVSGSAGRIRHLVYPVPHEEGYGLGVHATLDLQGYIRLGPDANYVENINYDVSLDKRPEFYAAARTYLPWLKEEQLNPDTSGIRPKLQGPKQGFRDFVIKEERENGLPKFINLIGIESPGLTASLAIGEYILQLIFDQK